VFVELMPLLKDRTLLITVARLDEKLKVNVIPARVKETEDQELTTPLSFTGSAEELDAELGKHLASYVDSRAFGLEHIPSQSGCIGALGAALGTKRYQHHGSKTARQFIQVTNAKRRSCGRFGNWRRTVTRAVKPYLGANEMSKLNQASLADAAPSKRSTSKSHSSIRHCP
jgi:PRTRC genetic system protein E